MLQAAIKVIVSALVIVSVSELAKRSSFVGAIVSSLPLTSLLAIIWLFAETNDATKVAALADGIFWLVLPSLVLFLLLPVLLRAGTGFWTSLGLASAATVLAYAAEIAILRIVGVKL